MKKITAMLLCLMMALALVGCGEQESNGSNEITALFEEGYMFSFTSYDETSWAGIFQKDDSLDTVYKVTAAMTKQQYEDYSAIGFDDEDYEAKQKELLGQLADVTVTDITDKLPSQETLDSYIGMTMGELVEAGFEKTGYMGDPGMGYEFFFDGPEYSLSVTPENSKDIQDMNDYSENDILALKIGAVEFTGFSFNILGE